MNHIGLFAGIGGFELAARWAGWETVAWCEWDKFCQRVLSYHFPEAKQHGDIKTTDFSQYGGTIDIVTGGFPCQPYSTAGKRLGKDDERHLWPEMLRAIREIQPRWVVGENVRGLTNWNGGVVFDEVQTDLETEGYEVIPFLLPACGVDAPHIRDRIWFVAYACRSRREQFNTSSFAIEKGHGIWNGNEVTRNPECSRWIQVNEKSKTGFASQDISNWRRFPTQPPICSRNDGISYGLDGITFPKWRAESIKAYGNAIVPQVAHQIFKAINQFEQQQWEQIIQKREGATAK